MGQELMGNSAREGFTKLINIQEARFKKLAKSKAYRDSVGKWGEPPVLQRKRVIIAPPLCTADGKDVTPRNIKYTSTTNESLDDARVDNIEASSCLENRLNSYRSWIEQRKDLRKEFDKCTEKIVELKPVESEILQIQKGMVKDEEKVVKSRLPSVRPSLSHPLPQKALGKIHKFLCARRMRMYDLFVRADRDKDWKISRKEFEQMTKDVGIPISDVAMEQLLHALDQNNDDVLEYKELVHGLNLFVKREKLKKDKGILQAEDDLDDEDELEVVIDPQPPKQNPSLLSLPDTSNTTDCVANMEEEKRQKKQKKREKHRKKVTKVAPQVQIQLCSMGGEVGGVVDKFQERTRREYEKVLELCHLHGVKLSNRLLEKVLLHPNDKSVTVCVSSLRPSEKYLSRRKIFSETDGEATLAPVPSDEHAPKMIRRKSSLFSDTYPQASVVRPRKEKMILSSGPAEISRKTDCWMTYEEYRMLTRHLDSRFVKSWKPSSPDAYWPSYVLHKVRLYFDGPGRPARHENSIFQIINNKTIH